MTRGRVRHHTIYANVTVEVDVDDLELTPEDLGSISLEKLWIVEELRNYARHLEDCLYGSLRYCTCGLTHLLDEMKEILP